MSDQEQNPYAPPIASHEVSEEKRPPPPLGVATKGQRVAGALLIANAALIVLSMVVTAGTPETSAGTPGGSLLPAAIDLGIGVSLVSGKSTTARWAVLRAGVGLVVWAGVQATKGEWILVALQTLVCASFLVLLIGNAGRARIAAGATAFGLYALVSLVGLVALASGHVPGAATAESSRADLEPEPVREVTGVRAGYSLRVPNDLWYLSKAEVAKAKNPLVDRWLVRPDKGTHLVVVVEDLPPGTTLAVDAYADAVLAGASKTAKDVTVLERHPLAGHLDDGIFAHTTSTVSAEKMESYYVMLVGPHHAYQIIAVSDRSTFTPLAAEIRQILASFKLPAPEPEVP